RQKRDERCQSNNYEEWEASDPGQVSRMRDQDV
ncbi:unnamed protein product, partial [marine sediment metagenome]